MTSTPNAPARVPGPIVLAGLTALVVMCMTVMVVWARATPAVPDARERRREFALPGAEPGARPPPMGAMGAPPARGDGRR